MHKYHATLIDIPFHVLIVYNNLYCSGALLRSKIVVTAASCLLSDKIRRPVVKVGADSITGTGQIIPVVEIKIHEYYKYLNRIDNDIALLVLKEDVEFNDFVKKAIIVEPEVALRPGTAIDISGWGSTNLPQGYANQLIWTEMIVIDKTECAKYYKNLLSPSNFCAKYLPERRLSDSGGPAVYNRELLVGILSFGGISSEEPFVAILTNMSYFHRWMLLNTKRFQEQYCVPRADSSYSMQSNEEASEST
ncbi:trypsin-5-like isoform X2 [Trichoplusia ni]|nr:trypsin-5-like isoform X2 [Trichoplusia ni]XP_026726921.1 trypsin-5-like isoform X2 [Trichoplusia ni]